MEVVFRIHTVLFIASLYYAYACDLKSINDCMGLLRNRTNASIDTMSEGIAAIPSEYELKALCGSLSAFKQCYDPKAEQCSGDVLFSMTLGTIEDTLNFLCLEGFEDVLRYSTCWNQTRVIEGTTKCHETQTEMILGLRLVSPKTSAANQSDTWCRILKKTTTCMRSAVDGVCGAQPACVMYTMMTRALSGLSSLMRCSRQPPCSPMMKNIDVDKIVSTSPVDIQAHDASRASKSVLTSHITVFIIINIIVNYFFQ